MPHRELLQAMTFGVVIISILVQGLTMGPLLRWLGLTGKGPAQASWEKLKAQIRTATAALAEVRRMEQDGSIGAASAQAVAADYEARLAEAKRAVGELHLQQEALVEAERREAARRALTVEKDTVLTDRREGRLGAEAAEALLSDIDARLVRLQLGDDAH
jgi:CPA1 family monovalent cation:H+ antiporter